MSIPGERLGYIAVSSKMADGADVYASVMGAGRALGYVNPPSLFQRVVEKCLGQTADVSKYRENRDLLCSGLSRLGFDCVKPQGAFYLFVKSPEPDAKAFSDRAKKHELLLVPSDDFGCPGYVRIAYCVSSDMIRRSMPAFKALAEEYNLARQDII
jgi:aspartate aminotransferase